MKEDNPVPSLFPTAYLPPVSYLLSFVQSNPVMEKQEHFVKQTYRNRCYICGPNGIQRLVVPVVHDDLYHMPVSEVRISYAEPWPKLHWRSIRTAYNNSPCFLYFEKEFEKVYENPPEKLFDLNLALFRLVLKCFQINKEIPFTNEYDPTFAGHDFRNAFSPNIRNEVPSYRQVFDDRHGFMTDVSCIDLLFNVGKI